MSDTEQLRKDLHRLVDKVKAHGVLSRVCMIEIHIGEHDATIQRT